MPLSGEMLEVDPQPKQPALGGSPLNTMDVKLDQIVAKVDACLAEIMSMKSRADAAAFQRQVSDTSRVVASQTFTPRSPDASDQMSLGYARKEVEPPTIATISVPLDSQIPGCFNISESDEGSTAQHEKSSNSCTRRRVAAQSREVDLQLAWQLQTESNLPMMRLIQKRSRAERLWEFLDDSDSSRSAWWTMTFLKALVVLSVLVSFSQAAQPRLIEPNVGVVLEAVFDIIFLVEFLCRLLTAPSKRAYLADPLNWADMLSSAGLPLRAAHSFATSAYVHAAGNELHAVLLFFIPPVRFLKLLRYFESFRLLIDACRNSAEALPFLTYMLAIIVVVAGNAIYLVEPRSNIPTIQHSLWLAMVTMTTVGYGDFYPVSLGGYVAVSVLTLISVMFLALPVGIIGNEFCACWQGRSRVLLVNRVRKALDKWGFKPKDVQSLFEYVDESGVGSLDVGEFVELISQMRVGISVENALQIFMLFDDDKSGTLDYKEFLRHIFPQEHAETQQGLTLDMRKSRKSKNNAIMALRHLESMQEPS
mmetsp:Transcript_55282/g.103675  ORF Transcript_55282/g.103675 Transcript_55282/m.103675 type:complete len:535 (-) Transcript_55282:136-1740(-)